MKAGTFALRPERRTREWTPALPSRRVRHRRRWLRWVFRTTMITSGCLGVAVLGHAGWGLLQNDSAFSVRRIQVIGLTRHDEGPLKDALRSLWGRNLFTLKPGEVADRVAAFPWLNGFLCRKHLPDTLIVEVQERPELCAVVTPSGVIEMDGQGMSWPATPGVAGVFKLEAGLNPDGTDVQSLVANLLGLGLAGRVVSIAGAGVKGSFVLTTPDGWSLTVNPTELQRQWEGYTTARQWVQQFMPERKALDLRWHGKVILEPQQETGAEGAGGGAPSAPPSRIGG